MALVNYSDSDEDNNDNEDGRPLKRKADDDDNDDDGPPPLPASFLNLYSSSVRVSNTDDPALHHGRKRVVKHVEGNWPTHVYLEWLPSTANHNLLTRLLSALPDSSSSSSSSVHSLLQTPLHVPLPLHISLSAPLVLRTDTKHAFLDSLTPRLTNLVRSLRNPITIQPASLSWHANEDKSRYFLVLRVQDAPNHNGALILLNKLLSATNHVAQQHGQPPLYTNKLRRNLSKQQQQQQPDTGDYSPYLHISIAWALASPDKNLQDDDLSLHPALQTLFKDVCNMTIPFDAVKIRIGQVVTAIPIGSVGASNSRVKDGIFG